MNWSFSRTLALLAVLSLAILPASAQQQSSKPQDPRASQPAQPQQTQQQPAAPGEAGQEPTEPSPTASASANLQPDSNSLSGTEAFSLGLFGGGHSFVISGLRYQQSADSNGLNAANGTQDWQTVGSIGGNLGLQRVWRHSRLALDYLGGGTIYSRNTNLNATFQSFDIGTNFDFRRVSLSFHDAVSYFPDSSALAGGLGYGPYGAGGIGGFGSGPLGGGFGQGFGTGFGLGSGGTFIPGTIPNQTIITGSARRIANTVVGQMTYQFSARDSFTLSGIYGILRFLDGSFTDSTTFGAQAGYSRQFTARDTFAILYRYGAQRFVGVAQEADTHAFHLSYGRRITGRMALQVAGGPRIDFFTNPVAGPNHGVNWSMNGTLTYQYPRTRLSLRYFHGLTGGSGVLIGANTDRLQFSVGRPLGRVWQGGATIGYARNSSIQQLSTTSGQQTFNGIDGGVSLGRPLGRQGRLTFNYSAHRQSSNASVCTPGTTACGTTILRHTLGLAISWGFGPWEID